MISPNLVEVTQVLRKEKRLFVCDGKRDSIGQSLLVQPAMATMLHARKKVRAYARSIGCSVHNTNFLIFVFERRIRSRRILAVTTIVDSQIQLWGIVCEIHGSHKHAAADCCAVPACLFFGEGVPGCRLGRHNMPRRQPHTVQLHQYGYHRHGTFHR